ILFIHANPEKSAILVKIFASRVIPITTATKVIEKAIISMCSHSFDRLSRRKLAVKEENLIATKIHARREINDAKDTKKPLHSPRIKLISNRVNKVISSRFIFYSIRKTGALFKGLI